MKKLIIYGGGMLLMALVVYTVMAFGLGMLVKTGVNNFGPKLTQTKVELKGAMISPFTGAGSLNGLAIGNPPGWKGERLFFLEQVHIDLEPLSVIKGRVVINEILIDGPEFNYETKFVTSNLKELIRNIESYSKEEKTGAEQISAAPSVPVKFIVKRLRVTNAKATLGVGASALPLPLPTIEIENLGVAENGITPDQVVGALMKQVLAKTVAASASALGKVGSTTGATATEAAKDAAKKAGEGLKKLFGNDGKP